MPSVAQANLVKGVALRNFAAAADKVAGAGAWERVRAAVTGDVAEALRHGSVVSGGWYDIAWYAELHRAAVRAGLSAQPSFAWAFGRESTRMDLSGGVYQFILKVISPAFLISRAPLLFSSYYKHGAMSVSGTTATHTRAQWQGCTGFTAAIWQDVVGGCEGALVAAGARDVVLRIASGGRDGDDSAMAEADWH